MASSLYNLALDFSKELNYTKAIMARQGDKGITVTVKPFLNGLQMDTSVGTFTLKGTTPSGRYVDSVAISVTNEEVVFSLDGTFMSEPGYYQRCYVEFSSEPQVLTTQDIIFFSLGVSDITQGQAAEYVSQLEALIKKYNETFEQFMDEIENQSSQIQNDLNEMSEKAEALKTQMDSLKEQIAALDLDAWKDEVLKTSKDYTDSKYEEASQTFVAQESIEKGPLIFKNTSITTEDWNDIKDPGIYYCAAATGANMPYTGTLYGFLTVYNELAVIIQNYEFQGAKYMRTFAGNPAAWGTWEKIATSKDTSKTLEEANKYTDTEIKRLENTIYQIGEEIELPLASGFIGADGTTPKYRVDVINGKRKIQFMGAVSKTDGTLPSQGAQHRIATDFVEDLRPEETKMGLGATGELSTPSARIAMDTNGTLFIGNNGGKDIKYAYLDLFTYWLD
jgi:hypothetical protein